MQRLTLPLLGAISAVAAGALLSAATYEGAAQEADWSARAAHDWNKTCQSCHTVPDAVFETDRAFLRQITETS